MNAKDLETLNWIDSLDPTGEIAKAAADVAKAKQVRESLARFINSLPRIDAIN